MTGEQLTAAMVADIFKVSRSAVSQACKTYGIKADFERRVRKHVGEDLFFRTKQEQLIYIDNKTSELLAHAENVLTKRDQESVAGIRKGRYNDTLGIHVIATIVNDVVTEIKRVKNL